MYPKPLLFTPDITRPLLVLSCSETKRDVGDQLTRFCDLYAGPLWQQVAVAQFPWSNVAAISALHGFLEPGMAVRTYERKMDEKISRRICSESNHVARFRDLARTMPSTFVVGGPLYRAVGETALRVYPELRHRVTFATGSFLQLRKQLNDWLRREASDRRQAVDVATRNMLNGRSYDAGLVAVHA